MAWGLVELRINFSREFSKFSQIAQVAQRQGKICQPASWSLLDHFQSQPMKFHPFETKVKLHEPILRVWSWNKHHTCWDSWALPSSSLLLSKVCGHKCYNNVERGKTAFTEIARSKLIMANTVPMFTTKAEEGLLTSKFRLSTSDFWLPTWTSFVLLETREAKQWYKYRTEYLCVQWRMAWYQQLRKKPKQELHKYSCAKQQLLLYWDPRQNRNSCLGCRSIQTKSNFHLL